MSPACHYLPVSRLGHLRLPWAPVVTDCLGGPLPYHRKLTGQQLERLIASPFIMKHHEHNRTEGSVCVWVCEKCACAVRVACRVLRERERESVCVCGVVCCCVVSCTCSVFAVSYCVRVFVRVCRAVCSLHQDPELAIYSGLRFHSCQE